VVAVASWAGTRGVVPLAAALSIPLTLHDGSPFPHRDLLLVLATTCTAITLVVQGLTLGVVVRRTGFTPDAAARDREEAIARHAAVAAAVARLDEIQDLEAASPAAIAWLRREFTDRLRRSEGIVRSLDGGGDAGAPGDESSTGTTRQEMRTLRRDLIDAESARLHELVEVGVIGEPVRRRVQRMLDLEEARSTDE
jgi:CPA1 family monovalent cation:H+ antiporter